MAMDAGTMIKGALDAEGIGHMAGFAKALWQQESGGSSGSDVVGAKTRSGEKARSPFQIMPATARAFGYKGSDDDLQRPEIAAPFVAKKIKEDFTRFGGNIADMAAAYYAGPRNVKKDAQGNYIGGPPPGVPGPSINEYVKSVMARIEGGEPIVSAFQPADTDATITQNFAERRRLLEESLTPLPEHAGMFDAIMAQIQGQQAPEPMAVPERTSNFGRALAAFTGGMNAVQTGSGQLAQNLQSQIAQNDAAASGAEELNYARKQAFDTQKENKLLDIKMKILEMKREDAVKRGDRDLALKIAEQELKLSEKLKKEKEDRDAQTSLEEDTRKQATELAKIEAQTQGRLKLVDRKAAIDDIGKDYDVPKSVASTMHDHRMAITTAYQTQMAALGGIASLPDAKAKQLRQELIDDLLESDRRQLEIYQNSAEGKAAAVVPPAAAAAPAAAPTYTEADSVGYFDKAAPTDTTGAAPAAAPAGRGRLKL